MLLQVAIPAAPLDTLTYWADDELTERLKPGALVQVPLRNRSVVGLVVNWEGVDSANVKPIQTILASGFISLELVQLMGWMRRYYLASWGEILRCAIPRWAYRFRPWTGLGPAEAEGPFSPPPTLNFQQHKVVEMVSQALRKGTGQVFLLHDWDGGGRLEVYLRLVEEALHQGRSALILVPEIALTPKLLGRFSQRFPNCLAPFYSTLTRSQLKRCWHGARTGQIRAVVGSRSAVFVPLNDLGLIIVAEEEDTSYKERRRPYYNARDVAIARGGIARAVVLLSSLAPSLESIFKVKQGEYKFLKLSGSKAHKPNPLKIVDMRKKWGVLISAPLRDEIRRKLMTGEPIILFLNRRGFARSISCSECGWVAQCPNCGLPLIYHRVDRGFKCHLCNYRQPGFDECPRCHGSQFIYTGMGTQRLEEELRRLIPGVQIQRLDGDTLRSMRAKSARFHPGPSIYLGTMAVIQGFQFPARALLGMVSADTFLDRPDFRASERLFQFLIRAARRADQVVVQTAHPDSYAIRYAQDQKFEPFYAAELKLRQTLNYPPFSRLVRLIYPTTQSDVINLETLRQLPGVEVYGPEHKLGRISTSTVVLKVPPNITLEEVLMPERLHRFGVRVEVDPLEL